MDGLDRLEFSWSIPTMPTCGFPFLFSVVFLARAFWKRHVQKEAAQDNKSDSYYAANDYEAPAGRGTMT